MVKFIGRFSVLTAVLLAQLVLVDNTQAGFYDWLMSREGQANTLVSSTVENSSLSFEKIFSWRNRQPQNAETKKIIVEEEGPQIKVLATYTVRATGYSSTPDQTDDTPCHTATNYNVCTGTKNVIAANFYINGKRVPFGTLVRIPEIFREKIFVVEDRMNARYTNNIDVWFPERSLAKAFGSQKVTIEIVEES
ncbi:MAG: hypothetical protein A3B91_04990 [Candidatus Yanofskybacteria bacterium RIFCSPHIGHO2_02_FULL_41_29]|uniref:3D domain-containing protein n=1 Tax=Candidatus Yanofskybacteria bacterium RIFCSPHIGHO2_01_FULL_41_53 TaxID=1802663 RepID=A0A1F8EJ81_9BACT|nr:MAG: hypothetical protein A2650_03990 [Candidatus Yanofskybacteria bacterium RIFCSPHIGHO2_01_FULL_41_53]OGN11654.1 MAG: hypothetical protein A3B91_04990 [Candidatus Yanofskybacteria bacterium RIFCSPHIGHO2_02_FULL_41_29]OGN23413.1 MAG: hypothetical protein A2916_03380 [Candidatus Yanofskybacteria bacterium RIFCSPLOWO2_01_FULL_41_67]OGN29582.1 MAG: hypothetical protein A3H54_01650 [Candidatus Yanofskybacteria bacterium RIFCSPLOWO2_02_FULL_41_13]